MSQGSFSVTQCGKCGRPHSGVCQMGSRAHFKCGREGHYAKDCQQVASKSQGSQVKNYQPRQLAQARVYSLTPSNVEADENATDIVTSTFPLFGNVACILFDSGTTHSFILSTYVKQLSTEALEQNICVATLVGNIVTCRKCVDNYLAIIERKTLLVKLAMFRMLGFDVILGMDWLSKYGANIDFRKKVIFRLHCIEEFKCLQVSCKSYSATSLCHSSNKKC
jgi:hypothetical protein